MEETLSALEAKIATIRAKLAVVKNKYAECQSKVREREKVKTTSCIVNSILSNPEQLPLKRPRYKTKKKTETVWLARPEVGPLKDLKTVYMVNDSSFDRLVKSYHDQKLRNKNTFSLASQFFKKSDAFSVVSFCVREVLHRKEQLTSTEIYGILTSVAQVIVKNSGADFFKALRNYALTSKYQAVSLSDSQNLQQILIQVYVETAKKHSSQAFKKLVSELLINKQLELATTCFDIWPFTEENSLVIMQLMSEERKVDKLVLKFIGETDKSNCKDHFLALKTLFLTQDPHTSYKFYRSSISKAINKASKGLPGRHLLIKALGFLVFAMEKDDELRESTHNIVKIIRRIIADDNYTDVERGAASYALSKLGNI